MITIITGTNRDGSKTELVAKEYSKYLDKLGSKNQILKLSDLPSDIYRGDMYSNPTEEFKVMCKDYIESVDKFVFIQPEYNGSYPGVLKMLIDIIPPSNFYGSKAALVGVSGGRAGNIVGNCHLTDVLNHIKVNVCHFKLLLSGIDSLLDENGVFIDEFTIKQINEHAKSLIEF